MIRRALLQFCHGAWHRTCPNGRACEQDVCGSVTFLSQGRDRGVTVPRTGHGPDGHDLNGYCPEGT
jgi:hypothetical protein